MLGFGRVVFDKHARHNEQVLAILFNFGALMNIDDVFNFKLVQVEQFGEILNRCSGFDSLAGRVDCDPAHRPVGLVADQVGRLSYFLFLVPIRTVGNKRNGRKSAGSGKSPVTSASWQIELRCDALGFSFLPGGVCGHCCS